jgi:PKD repeat protein
LPQPKGGFTTVQGQSNLEFTANDTTATTYYWSFGDGQGKADYFRTVHTYAANGSYKVRLTVTNSCGTITYDSTLEVGTIGFLEPIAHSGCLVYPNPAKGLLSVVSSSVITSYSILDIRGREVTTQNLSTGVQKITIPTHRLIPGTYVLRLRTFNGVETHRVVVQ